ncbi:MAG: HAD family phosphatase [Verrucomicrobiales bacterium]|jgi:putative hydrolase of the HAD superfamily|nr:HAD family phosphatase [Verrucomicrobiales bacterium]
MKISTLFFDLGKVLVDFDFNIAFDRVAQRSPLDLEHLKSKAYSEYPLIDDYESGRIDTAQFFSAMKEQFQFDGSIGELELIWCDVFTPLEQNIHYVRSLAKHYPLGMISNTSDAHIRFLEARYDFFGLFQKRIYSYQVGHMKPNAEIYRIALEEMGGVKEESLFVDDLEANIMGASKLGWQTIHLRPDVDLRLALRSYELDGI